MVGGWEIYNLRAGPAIEWRASRHRVVLLSSRPSILKSERYRATIVAWHMSNPHRFGVRPRRSGASNLPMPVERSFHKPEFLFPLPEEMIRHNSRPTNSSLSFTRCALALIRYGEAMPTAAIRCSSPPSILATQGTPRWSPDGKWIAFDYRTTAHTQIYLVDSEGRNLHALTSGSYEVCVPSWSRDGKAVYFASNRTGDWQVWRRELSTGKETQITRHGGFAAFESYDAKALYYSKFEGGGIWKVPVGGGQEERVTDSLHRGYWGHFAVTDNGLYLVDSDAKGGPAIMYYNFQTRRLSSVLTFKQSPLPVASEPRCFPRRANAVLRTGRIRKQHDLDGGELPMSCTPIP